MVAAALAFLFAIAPADSQFIVLNHGRPAGEMRISAAGDSVVVRYQYQDRQRGPRIENRYRIGTAGRITVIETRGFSPEGVLGPVIERVEYYDDSVRVVAG